MVLHRMSACWILLFMFTAQASSQWLPQSDDLLPPEYWVLAIEVVDENVVWALADTLAFEGPTYCHPLVLRTTDGGKTWESHIIPRSYSMFLLDISAVDGQTAWVTMNDMKRPSRTDGGIFKTTDGGKTWIEQLSRLPGFFIHFFDEHDGLQMDIYPLLTRDGGVIWERTKQANLPQLLDGESVHFFSANNAKAAVGDTVWIGTTMGRVIRSTDRGWTWTAAATTIPQTCCISTLAFRDGLHGIAVACLNSATSKAVNTVLSRTSDGGLTWEDLPYELPQPTGACITAVPGTAGTYVIASSRLAHQVPGTAYTLDDGNTWTVVDNDVHNGVAFANPYRGWSSSPPASAPRRPYLEMWAGRPLPVLHSKTTSAPDLPEIVYNAPNPSQGRTTIAFRLPSAGSARMGLYDCLGRCIRVLADSYLDAGLHVAHFNAADLPGGMYYSRLEWNGRSATHKIIVLD